MQQWEYKTGSPYGRESEDVFLNSWGQDGWEHYFIARDFENTNPVYYFKRSIQQPSTVSSMVGRAFNEVEKEVDGMTDPELVKAYYEK